MIARSWRILVLVAWLAFFAAHAGHHLLRDFGVGQRAAPSSLLGAHDNRIYRYQLVDPNHRDRGALGSIQHSIGTLDGFFEVSTRLRIPELSQLPGLGALPLPGAKGTVIFDALLQLDDRYRLSALVASGSAFGFRGQAEGRFDHTGLSGDYHLDGIRSGRFTIPGIEANDTAGFDIGVVLPPGLQTGETFANRILVPSATPPHLRQETVFYTVGEASHIDTATGPVPVHLVTMERGERESARLWADEHGVIWRTELLELGLWAELTRITDRAGDEIWPVDRRPPPGMESAP